MQNRSSTDAPFRPRLRWGPLAAIAGAATGLAFAAVEISFMAATAGAATLRSAGVVVALDVLAGTALGLLGAAAAALALADPRASALAARVWALRHGEPGDRARFAALGLTLQIAPAAALVAGIVVARRLADVLADPANAPLVQVPGALVAALAVGTLALPLERALCAAALPLARRAPRLAPFLPVALLALGTLAAAIVVARDAALRTAVDVGPIAGTALLGAGVAAAALLLDGLLRARRRATLAALGGTGVAIAIALVTVLLWTGPLSRGAVVEHGLASSWPLRALERLFDADGDGRTWRFGRLDCNERDPAVHAGAVDFPGDGKDQDCDGADAKVMTIDFGPERAPGLPPSARSAKNVLLVTIDALRADHVGALGYAARKTTPRLDAFAADATLFERAYSPGSATIRVVPALLTGIHPLGIDWRPFGRNVEMDLGHTTIAEIFKARGFATASVDLAQPKPRPGFEQGFEDTFRMTSVPEEVYRAGNAAASAGKAIEWIDGHLAGTGAGPGTGTAAGATAAPATAPAGEPPDPFFLWVHFIDPHHPYHPHAETAAFGTDDLALYDGEIAYADIALGRVLDHLDKTGLAKDTLVVVTSDHGEHFGEHGERFHAKEVWEESIRVPLAVRLPGAGPHRVTVPVTTLDVPWTIYDLMDIPASGIGARPRHGASLAASVATGAAPPARLLVATAFDRAPDAVTRTAAIRWPLAVREDASSGARSCFDLVADPGQRFDVTAARPAECAAVFAELAAYRAAVAPGKTARAKPKRPRPTPKGPPAPAKGAGAAPASARPATAAPASARPAPPKPAAATGAP